MSSAMIVLLPFAITRKIFALAVNDILWTSSNVFCRIFDSLAHPGFDRHHSLFGATLGHILDPRAKVGKNKAEEIALQRLRGDNFDFSQEAVDIQEFSEGIEQTPEVGFLGLFQRRYALVVVFGLMGLAGFAGPSGVTYYASSVFESAGFSSSIGSTVMALLQVPSSAIGMYLIDKCGRRPLLMVRSNSCFYMEIKVRRKLPADNVLSQVSAGAMCFCCFLVGFMFLLRENDCLQSINPYLIVLGIWVRLHCCLIFFLSLFCNLNEMIKFYMAGIFCSLFFRHRSNTICPYVGGTYVPVYMFDFLKIFTSNYFHQNDEVIIYGSFIYVMSQMFPMNVKGPAGSLAAVVSSGSVWASSYTFNFMTQWSYPGTFFILGGLNAFTVLFAARQMPETKGKTLEELQDSLLRNHVMQ
ncbi:hypothetical protein V2J09_001088 [Rumex salicifolius]